MSNGLKYKVVICSYKRAKEFKNKTLKYLKDDNINFNCVYLFLANEEEKKEYIKTCNLPDGIKIIIGEVGMKNIRNCVVNYFNQDNKLFCIDDDIVGISQLKDGKLIKGPPLKELIRDTFNLMEQNGSRIMGLYPVCNAYFMNNYIEVGNIYICGSCYFEILDKGISHREVDSEDYNFNLNYFHKYRNNMRYCNYSAKTTYYAKGGMSEGIDRTFENKENDLKFLVNKYPDYVKIKYSKNAKLSLPKNVNLKFLKYDTEPVEKMKIIKDDREFNVLKVSKVKIHPRAVYLDKKKELCQNR